MKYMSIGGLRTIENISGNCYIAYSLRSKKDVNYFKVNLVSIRDNFP